MMFRVVSFCKLFGDKMRKFTYIIVTVFRLSVSKRNTAKLFLIEGKGV